LGFVAALLFVECWEPLFLVVGYREPLVPVVAIFWGPLIHVVGKWVEPLLDKRDMRILANMGHPHNLDEWCGPQCKWATRTDPEAPRWPHCRSNILAWLPVGNEITWHLS
jgi:hypothetical protein